MANGDDNQALSQQDYQDLQAIAAKLPAGHPAQKKINLLLNAQPTQFEQERSGGAGVMGTLRNMLPQDPTGGHSVFDPRFWVGEAKDWRFDPFGPGSLYSDLTRPLPKDLPTNVLSGDMPGSSSRLGRGIYRGTSVFAPLVGMSAEQAEESSGRGDTAGVATQALAPLTAMAVGEALRFGVPRARAAIGRAVRDPLTGKPMSPYKAAVEKVFPDPDAVARAQAQAAPINEKMRAESSAEFADVQGEIEAARQKELAGMERLKEQDAQARMRRGKEQSALDEAAEPTPSVVPPSAGVPRFTGSEGRAATWTNEAVLREAARGNREAISQAVRRGLELPAGARYVMGDPDLARAVYNPREVTRFTPEGEPIRNLANPAVRSSRATIQPTEASAPREVINASTGEVTNPFSPQPEDVRQSPFAPPEEAAQPNRRMSSDYERQIFQQMLENPENSQQVSQQVRQVRGGGPNGGIIEGAARNYLMRQPGGWEKFIAADEAGRRAMLIAARDALLRGAK